jgi:ribosomal protein S27AE
MTKETESSTLLIVNCPACSAGNELDQHHRIDCGKCEKPITGHTYAVKGVSAMFAFDVGVAGYGLVDRNLLNTERYPMELEYAMVNACANGDLSALPRQMYESKQEVCLCAIEKVEEALPYSELEERESEFRGVLQSSVSECL